MEERYGRFNFEGLPAEAGAQFLYAPGRPFSKVLDSQAAKILLEIQGFKTLDQHIEDRCEKLTRFRRLFKPLAKVALREVFSGLAKDGFLIPLSQALNQCREFTKDKTPPPHITTLGLVTSNRVELLERALVSGVVQASPLYAVARSPG